MKKDPGLIFRICLMLGDAFAIVFSFAFAYYIRTHIDTRPYYFNSEIWDFALTILLLVPIWLIILATLGLYKKSVFLGSKLTEASKLLLASALGTMTIITYDFFYQNNLFPVRLVALWATLLCFVFLIIIRNILRLIRRQVIRADRGTTRVIVIGDSKNTEYLLEQIASNPETGYRLSGVVAGNSYIPKKFQNKKYSSLKSALKHTRPDAIFQTDEYQTEYVYKQAVDRHLLYYFVPSEAALSTSFGQMELIGDIPSILVKVTPLIGTARIVKRLADIILSILALIIALIPMLIIWLVSKFSDLKHSPIYKDERLSLYNKHIYIYKFRSMKPEYSGLTPEQAFEKMGKPELIEKYRKNGDYLKNDPRVTKLGKFLRVTSLDELPQLLNVLKGDISLVGPRALVPGELRDYGDRSLLLSVKSGLTGLAQVSGRRDISFDERRALDIYYIQNWSILLDLHILIKTIAVVLLRKGAK
ncbi:exopolysaccharide biosynthesis polyprenyl glycosylphosphotransferase [Candidatus Saccharibacteria bacterium]|nr:exopolysaccharide biosynthesis polyprenyl glycosylphosphotransferase [Candidatus Saccharibacteria bacterium]